MNEESGYLYAVINDDVEFDGRVWKKSHKGRYYINDQQQCCLKLEAVGYTMVGFPLEFLTNVEPFEILKY